MQSRKAAGAAAKAYDAHTTIDQFPPIGRDATLSHIEYQAVAWLAHRAKVSIPTARAIAAANSWGRV